jgi:hypothetical protein
MERNKGQRKVYTYQKLHQRKAVAPVSILSTNLIAPLCSVFMQTPISMIARFPKIYLNMAAVILHLKRRWQYSWQGTNGPFSALQMNCNIVIYISHLCVSTTDFSTSIVGEFIVWSGWWPKISLTWIMSYRCHIPCTKSPLLSSACAVPSQMCLTFVFLPMDNHACRLMRNTTALRGLCFGQIFVECKQ